jgi:uncharacterized protein (DUF1499 family)
MADTTAPSAPGTSWLARNDALLAKIAFAVALIGALVAISSGEGYQLGLWGVLQGFNLVRWGAYIAGAGAILSLLAVIATATTHRGELMSRSGIAVFGLILGLIAFGVPYSMQGSLGMYPPIHDITTDLNDPPEFVDAVPLRKAANAVNNKYAPTDEATPAYMREVKRGDRVLNVPELQAKAYPDIKPVILAGVTPQEAFDRALRAVKQENWHLIAAHPDQGRIEAWDKTPWFGFVDDVVIRVRPDGDGSRIDVRSVSRIGGGDIGKNAKRIRGYIRTLLNGKG